MAVVFILRRADFGQNNHREDAPYLLDVIIDDFAIWFLQERVFIIDFEIKWHR